MSAGSQLVEWLSEMDPEKLRGRVLLVAPSVTSEEREALSQFGVRVMEQSSVKEGSSFLIDPETYSTCDLRTGEWSYPFLKEA